MLVASRTKPPGDAVFSLPGGVVELGETLTEAALRELSEEVGVQADVVGFAGHVEVIERDADAASPATSSSTPSRRAGRAASRWPAQRRRTPQFVRPGDLAALRTTPGLAGIVERARALVEAQR